MNKIFITLNLLTITLVSWSLFQAEAAKVKISNENRKSITIKITPEGSIMERPIYKQNLPAERYFEFNVSASDIGGREYFSIEGDTNPLMGDTCKHLSINKNYNVTFQDDAVGTTCLAQEMN